MSSRTVLTVLLVIGWVEGLVFTGWSALHPGGGISPTKWGHVAGVPIAVLGVAYYLLFAAAAVSSRRSRRGSAVADTMASGLIFTAAWLVSVQGKVLHHWCPRCLAANAAGVITGASWLLAFGERAMLLRSITSAVVLVMLLASMQWTV